MSTRGAIGIQIGNKIHGIYSHFDNYLDHTGVILFENYDREKTLQLIQEGDMSSIGENIESCEFYHRDRGENKEDTSAEVFDTIQEFLKHFGNDYMYYMDENDVWWVSNWGDDLNQLEYSLKEEAL